MKPLTKETEKLFKPLIIAKQERLEISLDNSADGVSKFVFEFYSLYKDAVSQQVTRRHPISNDVYRFIERLPEHLALGHKGAGSSYLVGATDFSALLVHMLWPRDQLNIKGQDTLTMYKYLLLTSIAQEKNIERIANFKLDKTAHGFNGELLDNKEHPLTPYQKLATVCALNSEAFALHMQQGTGKTPVAINVMCNLARKFRQVNTRMFRTLIVVPKNVRANWVDEIDKFKTIDGRVTVLRGTVIDRTRSLLDAMRATNGEKFTAVIVSYEMMTRMLETFRHIEWDLCIMDEMHNIASHAAKRTKASMILRDLCHRRLGLTGTPIRNHALDLYSQLEFLGKGFSGFSSWKTFKNFYGSFEKTDYGEKLIGIQNLPMIRERLARLSYNITKEEALPDLPDKVYDVVEVEMTSKQTAAYKELSQTLMLEIETKLANTDGPNRQLVVQNILVQLLRLAQITSGFCVFDAICNDDGEVIEPKLIEFFDPNPKLDTLVKLIKGDKDGENDWEPKGPNDKTIVWACWTADIKVIYERLIAEGIKCVRYYGGMSDDNRDAAVKAFNEDPTVKVFIGNAAAGGVGLNLLGYPPGFPEKSEANANHVVYYSQNWSQVQRSQSEDRAHRRGTREPVRITDLCVANSIDEEIRARVVQKKKMALEISDVRSIMRAVLTGVIDDE